MFFRESPVPAGAAGAPDVAFAQRPAALAVVGVSVAVTLVLGIVPQPLLDLASAASSFAVAG